MKKFLIKFRHGLEIEEYGESVTFVPPRLTFLDIDGKEIMVFQDSDIVSCEEVATK